MSATLPLPQVALAPALLAGPVHLQRTQSALSFRGGGSYGHPPSRAVRGGGGDDDSLIVQPPIGEVVGAGAVGVLAGESCILATVHIIRLCVRVVVCSQNVWLSSGQQCCCLKISTSFSLYATSRSFRAYFLLGDTRKTRR